ncbi:hypothetical protein JN11_03845 [Mucilaginibacter frigoritolerans]|jgi:hypothetical protein|uniref:Uncharacterized protein n=1 Tax=Mucilaginibacter frigoritolerans TaxID=652788 RepID=A0A562TTF9_9SPHI|nr:hypothetical protein JN11_03845 [Mucilaginibacter frigoritolerans]
MSRRSKNRMNKTPHDSFITIKNNYSNENKFTNYSGCGFAFL